MSEVLGKYWGDLAPRKVPHRGPIDDAGIPLYYPRRHPQEDPPVYHPGVICLYALANYNLALGGQAAAEEVFMRCARWLETHAIEEPGHRFLGWPLGFPLRTPPVLPPWTSGMVQGEVLSILARAFLRTKLPRTADVVQHAARAFMYDVREGGVIVRSSGGGCFIEEIAYPSAIHILNGCLTGAFGLYEYLRVFPDPQLQAVFEACLHGVEHWLSAFDNGYWSCYSLGIHRNVASVHYHRNHIRQLNHLGKLLNRPALLRHASKWQGYERSRRSRYLQRLAWVMQLHGNRAMTVLLLHRLKYRSLREACQ